MTYSISSNAPGPSADYDIVADVVPSGELGRLRETIEVLSDPDALRDLADTKPVVQGRDAIRGLMDDRAARDIPA